MFGEGRRRHSAADGKSQTEKFGKVDVYKLCLINLQYRCNKVVGGIPQLTTISNVIRGKNKIKVYKLLKGRSKPLRLDSFALPSDGVHATSGNCNNSTAEITKYYSWGKDVEIIKVSLKDCLVFEIQI